MDWSQLLQPLVVAAVPIAVAGVKKMVSTKSWLLPPMAAGFGVAADVIVAYTTNQPVNPATGAVLGLAGVGLREFVDQFKKATAP